MIKKFVVSVERAKLPTESEVKEGMNAALALFNKRWVLRILWELRDGRRATFRQLQQACSELSSSVLNVRLSELRFAELIEHEVAQGYGLTASGEDLLVAMRPLAVWASKWHENAVANVNG
jgi:DNA-binding HxlR family transcriptional regulator